MIKNSSIIFKEFFSLKEFQRNFSCLIRKNQLKNGEEISASAAVIFAPKKSPK